MKEYIEREALKILFAGACAECRDSCAEFDGIEADCDQCLLNGVIKDAKSIPAADVVERASGIIGAIPAADVRPVVLCRECKHRPSKEYGRIITPKDADGYTDYKCPFVCEDSWYNRMPANDDYCSCGEKREES